MGVSKNRWKTPQNGPGLFHGEPYEQIHDLGGKIPLFLVQHPYRFGCQFFKIPMPSPLRTKLPIVDLSLDVVVSTPPLMPPRLQSSNAVMPQIRGFGVRFFFSES